MGGYYNPWPSSGVARPVMVFILAISQPSLFFLVM